MNNEKDREIHKDLELELNVEDQVSYDGWQCSLMDEAQK